MVINSVRQMTVEEYLAFELESEFKHEYIDGEIYPMTGGTLNHSAIMANTIGELRQLLKESNCQVHTSEMRVLVNSTRYVYPDLSVVCGAPATDHNTLTLLNPTLVAEVTSPSSEDYDRAGKRTYYQALPSLQIYLVIDQHEALVEAYLRHEGGWLLREYSDLDAVVPLPPLGCDLPLAEIYAGIYFDAAEASSAAE